MNPKITRDAHNRKPAGVSARNCLMGAYRANANKRKIPFLLSKEEFIFFTTNVCFYCGIAPLKRFPTDTTIATKLKENKRLTQCLYNGIDRVDPSKAYHVDNCVTCCEQCNFMKSDYSSKEFLDKILAIHNHNFSLRSLF